jgi:hypothetical protein
MKAKLLGLLAAGLLATPMAAQAGLVFDRSAFEASLDKLVTDDYENSGYVFIQNNDDMTSVLNETRYTSTNNSNLNIVTGGPVGNYYCAGCNGSFLLDFTSTSVGTTAGVYGVGFDFVNSTSLPYIAYIIYGDGSSENLALSANYAPTDSAFTFTFLGITSDLLISSIHFGLSDGGATGGGYFGIDNLTIGSITTATVPEPGTLALLGLGLVGMGMRRRIKAS